MQCVEARHTTTRTPSADRSKPSSSRRGTDCSQRRRTNLAVFALATEGRRPGSIRGGHSRSNAPRRWESPAAAWESSARWPSHAFFFCFLGACETVGIPGSAMGIVCALAAPCLFFFLFSRACGACETVGIAVSGMGIVRAVAAPCLFFCSFQSRLRRL